MLFFKWRESIEVQGRRFGNALVTQNARNRDKATQLPLKPEWP